MPRSKANWDAYFRCHDEKNISRRKRQGDAVRERKPPTGLSVAGGMVLPRVIGDPPIFVRSYRQSHIVRNARKRRASPTRAEAELNQILNGLKGGILRGRFKREHVVSGKWIVDFFFPEIRLAIEVDGSVHDTHEQQVKDRQKDADCILHDITVLRLSNSEVFGDHRHLIERLRGGWRAAKNRENRIVGRPR